MFFRFAGPQSKSASLLSQLTARITPNKSQNQQQEREREQERHRTSSNEPIYQRRTSQQNQYYDQQPTPQQIYNQQQLQQQQIYDGKKSIFNPNQSSTSSYYHQNPASSSSSSQHHQYNYSQYNQNIYVSTNPFITPPSNANNYSPSSFGKDVTPNYSSKSF